MTSWTESRTYTQEAAAIVERISETVRAIVTRQNEWNAQWDADKAERLRRADAKNRKFRGGR